MSQRIALVLGMLAPISAQFTGTDSVFADKHRRALAENPAALTLELRTLEGRAVFRQGEAIEVQLSFSSATPKAYRLGPTSAPLDRHLANKNLDIFVVDRPGDASDPLRDDFNTVPLCGLKAMLPTPVLGTDPIRLTVTLNKKLRFDRAGKFRLFVSSRRVVDKREQELLLTSNVIELEIQPANPQFSARVLRESLEVIDSEISGPEERERAAQAIRFLGTEAAEREMVRRFNSKFDEVGWEFRLGLIGSARPAFVRRLMEEHLTAPDGAVSLEFLRLLALLSVNADPAGQTLSVRQDAYSKELETAGARLIKAMAQKRGPARTASLDAALIFASDAEEWRLRDELNASTASLAPIEQYRRLTTGWSAVESESILPLLRKIYGTWTDLSRSDNNQTGRRLREIALVRILELSDREGRKLITAEVGRGPEAELKLLGSLPDPSIPKSEEASSNLVAPLVAEYASAVVEARIRALNGEAIKRQDCTTQEQYLKYFLRVDAPAVARLVQEDWSRPPERACLHVLLSELVQRDWSLQLENLALEHLDDPQLEVAREAALLLGRFGSSKAEEHLWRRLERWNTEWKGRSGERTPDPVDDDRANEAQAQFESTLADALTCGQAWFATPERLNRLRRLCVRDICRSEAEPPSGAPIRLRVEHLLFGESWIIRLGHCYYFEVSKLKPKLAQFPRGTVFEYQSEGVGRDFLLDLTRFAEAHGLRTIEDESRPE